VRSGGGGGYSGGAGGGTCVTSTAPCQGASSRDSLFYGGGGSSYSVSSLTALPFNTGDGYVMVRATTTPSPTSMADCTLRCCLHCPFITRTLDAM
jgi:hypothetical protein